jgi:hypothetical protein
MSQIRTKKPVVIDPITGAEAVVYVRTANVIFTPDRDMHEATIVYSVIDTIGEGDDMTSSVRTIETRTVRFSVVEANQLEVALQVVGTTVSQRLTDIVPKLTMYQAGASQIYGLKPEDFEFYQG